MGAGVVLADGLVVAIKTLPEYPGLKLLPRVKKEHVQLNSYSRMRVDLAAQVVSSFLTLNTLSLLLYRFLVPLCSLQ